jgi:hypothetical protein
MSIIFRIFARLIFRPAPILNSATLNVCEGKIISQVICHRLTAYHNY